MITINSDDKNNSFHDLLNEVYGVSSIFLVQWWVDELFLVFSSSLSGVADELACLIGGLWDGQEKASFIHLGEWGYMSTGILWRITGWEQLWRARRLSELRGQKSSHQSDSSIHQSSSYHQASFLIFFGIQKKGRMILVRRYFNDYHLETESDNFGYQCAWEIRREEARYLYLRQRGGIHLGEAHAFCDLFFWAAARACGVQV